MFSRPRLGINTAVYGQTTVVDAIENSKALDVDGVLAKLGNLAPLSDIADVSGIALFGVELASYQIGQPTAQFEAILEAVQSNGGTYIVLPTPQLSVPATVEQASQIVQDVQVLAETAVSHHQTIVVKVVNRYESSLLNTIDQALTFLDKVERSNVQLMLSTFDLQIEEQDGAGRLSKLGEKLAFLAMSDSNHGAIGEGNIKLGAYLWAIQELAHEPPILLDVKRPFRSPFSLPTNDLSIQDALKKSRSWF